MSILIKILIIIVCGIGWRMGGHGKKWARNCVGGVIAIGKLLMTWNIFILLYWLALWGMTSLFSYGVTAPPHKFWVWIFGKGEGGDYVPVEIATRATCGFFWSLAGIIFAFITGRWMWQILYTVVLTILVVVFGLCKKVETSEIGTGASVALSIFI